jgi:uncharacterized protein (DUF849 family)
MLNREVIITCAVTGSGDTTGASKHVPITPEQIANASIEAAQAGAAIVHIHVRDPETGKPSRKFELYKEVVDRIRASSTDLIINLTTGAGCLYIPSAENPAIGGPGTDFVSAEERVEHVMALKPEICTLDCGTVNFHGVVGINTMVDLETMADLMRQAGAKPEIEIFELGWLAAAKHMISKGLIEGTPLFQFCLGIPWGAEADPRVMALMRDSLPENSVWAGFGISHMEMPMVAQAMLLGGHVRVGLEDNLYLKKGHLATNAELVEKAKHIIEQLGGRAVGPDEARSKIGLRG